MGALIGILGPRVAQLQRARFTRAHRASPPALPTQASPTRTARTSTALQPTAPSARTQQCPAHNNVRTCCSCSHTDPTNAPATWQLHARSNLQQHAQLSILLLSTRRIDRSLPPSSRSTSWPFFGTFTSKSPAIANDVRRADASRSVPPARPKQPAASATAPAQQSLAAASSEPSRASHKLPRAPRSQTRHVPYSY